MKCDDRWKWLTKCDDRWKCFNDVGCTGGKV